MELRHLSLHGHDVAFYTAGSGPVVVLIHGMAGSSDTWRHVVPALAERFTVVAPDLVGHGESAKPRGDYSLGAYASMVRDLMAALGHDHATIVGQSFGGGVAMQLAYQFPTLCERLVLVGSGGLGREVHFLLRALTLPGAELVLPLGCTRFIQRAGSVVARWLRRIGVPLGPALHEIASSYTALTLAPDRRAFVHTLRSVIDIAGQRVSAHDRLYLSSEIPTLLIWGDSDPIIPVEHAFAAHRAIRGSRLEVFGGVGHFPQCEEPERFARVLIDFIGSTVAAQSSEHRFRAMLLEGSLAPA